MKTTKLHVVELINLNLNKETLASKEMLRNIKPASYLKIKRVRVTRAPLSIMDKPRKVISNQNKIGLVFTKQWTIGNFFQHKACEIFLIKATSEN
jgi:hypothetical protein